eukprot:NODE_238_length_11959_cov_0.380270.p4 type:complete len:475 gc:universal NODE_238_length_11959_cov_0.380270:1889-465(-)
MLLHYLPLIFTFQYSVENVINALDHHQTDNLVKWFPKQHPLVTAVKYGHASASEHFLKSLKQAKWKTDEMNDPLVIASTFGYKSIVNLLLASKLKLYYLKSVYSAIKYQQDGILHDLLQYSESRSGYLDKFNESILSTCVKFHCLKCINVIIKLKLVRDYIYNMGDINTGTRIAIKKGKTHQTLSNICESIISSNTRLFLILIGMGNDITIKEAIKCALKYGNSEILLILKEILDGRNEKLIIKGDIELYNAISGLFYVKYFYIKRRKLKIIHDTNIINRWIENKGTDLSDLSPLLLEINENGKVYDYLLYCQFIPKEEMATNLPNSHFAIQIAQNQIRVTDQHVFDAIKSMNMQVFNYIIKLHYNAFAIDENGNTPILTALANFKGINPDDPQQLIIAQNILNCLLELENDPFIQYISSNLIFPIQILHFQSSLWLKNDQKGFFDYEINERHGPKANALKSIYKQYQKLKLIK